MIGRGVALALAVPLLVASCTSPDTSVAAKVTPSATPTASEAPRTSESASPEATAQPDTAPVFADRGFFPVGVTTLEVGNREAEVWYPGDGSSIGNKSTDVFNVLDVFPEEMAGLVPEGVAGAVDTGAYRNIAAASSGPYPVVVFSHGSPSFRQQSTRLTTHLASWGFVVLSVDHLERGLEEFLVDLVDSEADAADEDDPDSDPRRDEFDVQNALNRLEAANETPGSILEGAVDLEYLAVSGQSAGSSLAWRLAEMDAVDTVIAISTYEPVEVSGNVEGIKSLKVRNVPPGIYDIEIVGVDEELTVTLDDVPLAVPIDDVVLEPEAGGKIRIKVDPEALTPGSIAVEVRIGDKPALVISGSEDQITPPKRAEGAFAFAGLPKRLISIAGAGHDTFSDACIQIRSLGGLDAALGDLAAALGDLSVAADDGCSPESVDPESAQALAAHFMVAHLLETFEMADVSGALDPGVLDLIDGAELDDFQSFSE